MITAAYLLALLLFVCLVIAALAAGLKSSRVPAEFRPLLLYLLGGSLLVGASYLFVVLALKPPAGPWNILWVAGIPTAVALARSPRRKNLPLAIPLLVGGWVSSALVAWAFRIPLY